MVCSERTHLCQHSDRCVPCEVTVNRQHVRVCLLQPNNITKTCSSQLRTSNGERLAWRFIWDEPFFSRVPSILKDRLFDVGR